MTADRRRILSFAATLAIGLAGGAAASFANLPVAWLLGPALLVSVATLAGLHTDLPPKLRDVVFFLLGIQAGSGVTPAVAEQIALWPLSFAIQMLGVALTVVLSVAFLRRVFGWDKDTALFASLPGALSFVLVAATQTRADIARVTVVQSVRLILLIGALTPTLAWLEGGAAEQAGTARGAEGGLLEFALLFGICAVTAVAGVKLRLPGGLMLGALIGSAVLHGTSLVDATLPPIVAIPSLLLLGVLIGSRLRGIDRAMAGRLLPASLGVFALGLLASGLAGLAGVALLAIDFGTIALAYAPGALEALTILAFQFNLDPAYVAAHHVVRFMCIALAVPFLARRASSGRNGLGDPE